MLDSGNLTSKQASIKAFKFPHGLLLACATWLPPMGIRYCLLVHMIFCRAECFSKAIHFNCGINSLQPFQYHLHYFAVLVVYYLTLELIQHYSQFPHLSCSTLVFFWVRNLPWNSNVTECTNSFPVLAAATSAARNQNFVKLKLLAIGIHRNAVQYSLTA